MDLLLPCFMELMNAKPETNIEYFLYSLRNLFTLLESVQLALSNETWSMIFKGVILPMLDDFIYYSENSSKLPDTVIGIYQKMAAVFCSKMAKILHTYPQNFLLNDYYENL